MLRDSSAILGRVRTLFSAGALGSLGDRQLIELYRARRDETGELAFAVLVERHGPMVLGICRRMLPDPEDAADAFQATFLILVQKAATVRVSDSLGPWLHGVSRRVACQARNTSVQRRARERTGLDHAPAPWSNPGLERERIELRTALEDEIARLPEKYRRAVLLCDLGGMTHLEAANQLRCPVGTIESRLFRGREILRTRLVRRGLAPVVPGALVAARTSSAAVPSTLVQATLGAALRLPAGTPLPAGLVSASVLNLVKGAQRAMVLSRIKIAAGFLIAAGALGAGAGVLVGQERRGAPVATAAGAGPALADREGLDDRAKLAALEQRLQALEQRLDQLRMSGRGAARGDADSIRKIRPRFECLVENVAVKVGQTVRKGDSLAELFSADLAAAKNEFLAKSIQRNHARRLFDLRQKLVQTGAISQQLWVETENDEERSLHELGVARDRLQLYGLSAGEIDTVKDEEGEQKARFTLRSPVEGQVVEVGVAAGDLADHRSTLVVIAGLQP
jgi:RNA polymerase sigma factor (sigma-70 family)